MKDRYSTYTLPLIAVFFFGVMVAPSPASGQVANRCGPQIANGCGPQTWYGGFVPDYIFGEACDEHDCCYEYPAKDTKENCDDAFYNKMMEICNTYEFPWYINTNAQYARKECYSYAGHYHYAVKHWGDSRYNTVSGTSGRSDDSSDSGSDHSPFRPYEPSPHEQFCIAAKAKAEEDCESGDQQLTDFDCFEDSQVAFHQCSDTECDKEDVLTAMQQYKDYCLKQGMDLYSLECKRTKDGQQEFSAECRSQVD